MLYLVAYDIADKKRLSRVARLMKNYGARVQRSVFECHMNQTQFDSLIMQIPTVIKKREDKVTIYHLCEGCCKRFEKYGRGRLVDDLETWIY